MSTATTPIAGQVQQKLAPSELALALKTCFKAGRAPMVHGDPGIGKSQVSQQVADELFAEKYGYKIGDDGTVLMQSGPGNLSKKTSSAMWVPVPHDFQRPWFRDIRAALLDAVDIRGLPKVENGKASWAVPEFLPTDERGGVLFLDEINRGTEMVSNALFSLVTDGRVGEYVMPKTWITASAVNDQDVGARRMSSALSARFIHFDVGGNSSKWLDDVCKIAVARDWHLMVIAFLRSFPHLLHKYEPKARVSPNPRAWEFVSQICHQDPTANLLFSLVSGTIGEGAAREFCAFVLLYKQLPNIDAIFLTPETTQLPSSPSGMYAVSAALARRMTETNIGQAIKYLDRMPVEYNVACIVDAVRRNKSLQTTGAFTKWAVKHSDVTM